MDRMSFLKAFCPEWKKNSFHVGGRWTCKFPKSGTPSQKDLFPKGNALLTAVFKLCLTFENVGSKVPVVLVCGKLHSTLKMLEAHTPSTPPQKWVTQPHP